MELSSEPEIAADFNFQYPMQQLAPQLGHLCHMPSHINVLTGRYNQAILNNKQGIEADLAYFKYREENGRPKNCIYVFYTAHNIHFITYCAMFSGNYAEAMKAAY